MITYGDEVEMILHEIGDELIIEVLDSDHVQNDIMYLVLWNGIP